MSWIDLVETSELDKLPDDTVLVSNNGISIVYKNNVFFFKRSIPFLIENEYWCFKEMSDSGHVPLVFRWDKYTIQTTNIGVSEKVTNKHKFLEGMISLKAQLIGVGIRHGDLTTAAIIVLNNWPFVIDFAESRLECDPRPDKRPEGDEYWLDRTYKELC